MVDRTKWRTKQNGGQNKMVDITKWWTEQNEH
jgi:hypothetical protein